MGLWKQGLHLPFLKKYSCGEVAEWLKAAVLKTVMDREVHLEFESLPLRTCFLKNIPEKQVRLPCEAPKQKFWSEAGSIPLSNFLPPFQPTDQKSLTPPAQKAV